MIRSTSISSTGQNMSICPNNCIAHLKEYEDTMAKLKQAIKSSQEMIDELSKLIDDYKVKVNKKLATFCALPSKVEFSFNIPHYVVSTVKHLIFEDIDNILKQGIPLNPIQIYDGNPPRLAWGTTSFAVGDKESLSQLKQLIQCLEDNDEIRSTISEFKNSKSRIKMETDLQNFENSRIALVLELTKGQRKLKGHCDLCPRLF